MQSVKAKFSEDAVNDEKLSEDMEDLQRQKHLSNGNDTMAGKHLKHHQAKLKTEKSQLFSQITIEVPMHLSKQKQNHELNKRPSMVAEIRIDPVETPRRQSEPGVPTHRLHPRHLRLSPTHFNKRNSHRGSEHHPDTPTRGLRRAWRRSPSPSLATLNPGYDQYQKSLLEVPWCADYGDASSDDLSSEWDSDVPEQPPPSLPKVVQKLFHLSLG